LCGSPRQAGLAANFDNFKFFYDLIITHFRKFFNEKFSDLAANSFSKKKKSGRISPVRSTELDLTQP